MGDNQPKKPLSFFEKIRAAMTLRRPATVPKQLDTQQDSAATGSAPCSPVRTSADMYGESSHSHMPTTPVSPKQVSTKGESKKNKHKYTKSKRHVEKRARKRDCNLEEMTPSEEFATEACSIGSRATPEETQPIDLSETAESEYFSSAKSTQSKTSRKVHSPKHTAQWKNTSKGNRHDRTHTSRTNQNTSKSQISTPYADISELPSSSEGNTEETTGRSERSHPPIVKIFISNPLAQIDSGSVPMFFDLQELEQSTPKTRTVRVATAMNANRPSTSYEIRCSNMAQSGAHMKNSTRTPMGNMQASTPKGHVHRGSVHNTTAHLPLPTTARHGTKTSTQRFKQIEESITPVGNQIIFHKKPPTSKTIPQRKKSSSSIRPKTSSTDKSKTQEPTLEESSNSNIPMSTSYNDVAVGHENDSLRECHSHDRPQTYPSIGNSVTQDASQSKHINPFLPTYQQISNVSTRYSTYHSRPQTAQCRSNTRQCLASQSKLNKTFSSMDRSVSIVLDKCKSPIRPQTSRATSNSRVYVALPPKRNKTNTAPSRSRSAVSDAYSTQLTQQPTRVNSIFRANLTSQSKQNKTLSPTDLRAVVRPSTSPGVILKRKQFETDLESNSSIFNSTNIGQNCNVRPVGIKEYKNGVDRLGNCQQSSSMVTVPSKHCWGSSGPHVNGAPQESQGSSNFQSFERPSSERRSNMEINARSKISTPYVPPTTSFPFADTEKIRRLAQSSDNPSPSKILVMPLIREKTYLILPSSKSSLSNGNTNTIVAKRETTMLTRQNTFLILPPQEYNCVRSIGKITTLSKSSTSTPVAKTKRPRAQLGKIASENTVARTSSGIPLTKGKTYLIMPGTSTSTEDKCQEEAIIPLIRKATYLVMPSERYNSEITIRRTSSKIPLIRSSTYEVIKSKKIFSKP